MNVIERKIVKIGRCHRCGFRNVYISKISEDRIDTAKFTRYKRRVARYHESNLLKNKVTRKFINMIVFSCNQCGIKISNNLTSFECILGFSKDMNLSQTVKLFSQREKTS